MRINLYFAYFCLLVSFVSIFNTLFITKNNNNYSERLTKLINKNDKLNVSYVKNIKIENKDFTISYIKKNTNKKSNLLISNLTLDKDNKQKYNYESLFKNNIINISSKKYFNDLKFIFSNKELKNDELTKIFKTKIEKDVIKYMMRGNHILYCIIIKISDKKTKKCEKNYHLKINNFDLQDEIFNTYSFFYFKIDNKYLEFNDKQF